MIGIAGSEIDWSLDLITRVAKEGYTNALALLDTFGVTSRRAMQYLARRVKSRVHTRLEAYFHMDFAMGVANIIVALAEGVEAMHATVLGVGERAGNVPMEEIVKAPTTTLKIIRKAIESY